MRKALVTGGAGFIGSTLVDLLVDNRWQVLVVDDLSSGHIDNLARARLRGNFTMHSMDIRDDGLSTVFSRFAPDVVFHLAAQISVPRSVQDPKQDADVNITGSINVMEATVAAGTKRIVLTGSAGTYGSDVKLPARETYKRRPESPYGAAKKAIEDYARVFAGLHDLKYVVLTPANVYGPRQDAQGEGGVVSIFVDAITEGRPPTIFGDGSQTRDFVYVEDVADAFLKAADKGTGRNLNISTGQEVTIRHLYDLLADRSGFRYPARLSDARPGDILRSVLDPSAAEKNLGWRAWTSLADGLAQTLEWAKRR